MAKVSRGKTFMEDLQTGKGKEGKPEKAAAEILSTLRGFSPENQNDIIERVLTGIKFDRVHKMQDVEAQSSQAQAGIASFNDAVARGLNAQQPLDAQ